MTPCTMLLGKHVFTKGKEERMRLLLVEDEEDLIQAMARGLRQEGYAVDLALDGLRGWELLATNAYDLLMLDLNLPDLDGLELCQSVRAGYPQVLVLVLTARCTPRHRVLGLDQGADDYLVKPFHWEELLARMRALFRLDQSRVNDVIFLDVADFHYPFGLNLFTCSNPTDIGEVSRASSKIMHIFKKLWGKGGIVVDDAWGVLLEEILRNATMTFLEYSQYAVYTMAEIPLLLEDAAFRNHVVQK